MPHPDSTGTGKPFWVGDWYVDPRLGSITREGAEVRIEPKVMSVLGLLAQHAGEVVSRETLEDQVWPDVVVSYDALSTSIIKLRKALGDDTRQPRYLETLSKRGYRLIAPVRTDEPSQPRIDRRKAIPPPAKNHRPLYLGAGLLLGLVLLVGMYLQNSAKPDAQTVSPSDKITLAVLPFTNRTESKEQEYFSDGITNDLINDLSRYTGLQVVARRTAVMFKQRKGDIKTIANELKVRYVLDGDVRRDGNNIRINVQLVDGKTGLNVWAQRFDRHTKDIFLVQDDIRSNIIDALSVKLTQEERHQKLSSLTQSFAAYDLFLQGQASLVTRASASNLQEARRLMEQAIEFDPQFARAYATLALIHADTYRNNWASHPDKTRQEALRIGKRALELDPHSPQAHWILGYIYLFLFEDHNKALAFGNRAIALEPSNADAHNLVAVTHVYGDDPQKSKLIIQELMKRDQNYSALVPSVLGYANLHLGKLGEALAAFDESLQINPSRVQALAAKAVVLYRMGRTSDAEFQVAELYSEHPDFDVHAWAARQPFNDKRITAAMVNDLIKSGVKP